MRTFANISHLVVLTAATGIIGCASTLPPQELVNARSAYDRADSGPAAQLNPADLHSAKEQLDTAEEKFREDGNTQEARDQAYLALRKTELAEVVARTKEANQASEGVVDAMHEDQTAAVAHTSEELAQKQTQVAAQGAALATQGAQLRDAEKRAAQATADLSKFASVKQEPRGMVITLSGSVLFASAKSDLLPEAQLKLNDVANALIKEDPISKIVVEGHTDSQGSQTYNQELSQRRAQVVRDYLVTRGIASDRITAQGFGPSRSIADNTSTEGRANNRRVEIVVQPMTPAP